MWAGRRQGGPQGARIPLSCKAVPGFHCHRGEIAIDENDRSVWLWFKPNDYFYRELFRFQNRFVNALSWKFVPISSN